MKCSSSFKREIVIFPALLYLWTTGLLPAFAAENSINSLPQASSENSEKLICENKVNTGERTHRSIVERLKPGEELHAAFKRIASEHKLKAGVIVTLVGSLTEASLRFAGANEGTTIKGPFEIVSATGTISDTSMHVHLSGADSTGKTIGGHLMPGSKVYTTVELVILDLSNEWTFERKKDEQTSYLELDPRPVQGSNN